MSDYNDKNNIRLDKIERYQSEHSMSIASLKMRLYSSDREVFIDVVSLSKGQEQLIGFYRQDAEHIFLRCDCTNGNLNVLLPSAKDERKHIFIIKKVDNTVNSLTLTALNGETIDGAATYTTNTALINFNLISDRTNWWIAG